MKIAGIEKGIAITSMAPIAPTGTTIDEIWQNQINWTPNFKEVNVTSFTFSKMIQEALTNEKEHPILKHWLNKEVAEKGLQDFLSNKKYLPVQIRWVVSEWWTNVNDAIFLQKIENEIQKTPFDEQYSKLIFWKIKKGWFDPSILQSIYMSLISLNKAKLLWKNWIIDKSIITSFWHWFAWIRNTEARWWVNGLLLWDRVAMWPTFLVGTLPNMPAPIVSNIIWANWSADSHYNACAAASYAIAWAVDQIILGRTSIAITWWNDSTWDSLFNLKAFGWMWALAKWYEEDPNIASRPFSKSIDWNPRRKWFVLWDWWCIFTLEELKEAKKRWADVLWEISGIGLSTCNPIHQGLALSSWTVEWQSLAMQQALDNAWITAEEFKNEWWVIFAHGTATGPGDLTESKSIYNTFWDWVQVTAIKGVLGHALGWSSAQSIAIALKSMKESIIPWTLHYNDQDKMEWIPDWVDIIWENRKQSIKYALINAFWFWWHNSSILIKNI